MGRERSSHPLSLDSRAFLCEHCQSTLFTRNAFRKAWGADEDNSFCYEMSWRNVQDAAQTARGCHWCQTLVPVLSVALGYTPHENGSGDDADTRFDVKIGFKKGDASERSAGRSMLEVEVLLPDNGSYVQRYEVYANAGTPVNFTLYSCV
jgi:hypothetical protein